MNQIEQGVPDDGIRPKLIQQFGGFYRSATHAFRPMTTVLSQRLEKMDGGKYGTYIVYVQPGEPEPLDVLDKSGLVEYIQSAGNAKAMLIEVKRREADGILRQYAVGRDVDEEEVRTVSWAPDFSETVPAREVFTADEAHPVYLQWCWDQTIPSGYQLRLLDV